MALSETGAVAFKRNTLLALKNLLLPAFCNTCGMRILTEENLYFCADCWGKIELARDPRCPRCGRPRPARPGFEDLGNFICSDCSAQKQWVERTYAAGLHKGVLRHAIHLLKYRGKRLLAAPLAQLLYDTVGPGVNFQAYDMLVPVPLHHSREKQRGYNQSELIGNRLCSLQQDVPLAPVVRRVKNTPSFSMLGAPQRHKLIQKAFELKPDADVKKKRVLLLDDVVTTGATSNECARILLKKGAASVDVIALAVVERL